MNFNKTFCVAVLVAAASIAAAQPQSAVVTSAAAPNVAAGVNVAVLYTTITCPASVTLQAVSAKQPWMPGIAKLDVQTALITNQGTSSEQMICEYAGSGLKWRIYRNPDADFTSCTASGTQFSCSKMPKISTPKK